MTKAKPAKAATSLPIGATMDGESLVLPDDAVTQGFAILARRRSGKSTLAGVMEETFCQRGDPWVCFDPVRAHYGINYRDRAGQPAEPSGYDVLIVGGPHGHVPLEEHAGAQLAEVIVDTDISCVIDLRDESDAATRGFVAAFARELLKINTTPRHVFLEEAHEFVPQQLWEKGSRELTQVRSAVSRLIRNGGGAGIGFTLISQRPAEVAKSVLEQIDNLFILRMSGPNDIGAVKGWFEHNVGDREQLSEILSTLPALNPLAGEAWLCSPTWLHEITRVNIRPRTTYHAGRTPKKGERPVAPKQVELGKVIEQFRAAAERRHIAIAEERDIKAENAELRKKVAALEKGRSAPPAAPAAGAPPDETLIERRVTAAVSTALGGERRERQQHERAIAQLVRHAERSVPPLRSALDGLEGSLGRLRVALNGSMADGAAAPAAPATATVHMTGLPGAALAAALAEAAERGKEQLERNARARNSDPEGGIPAGSMKMLRELAARHPLSWTQRQLGSLSGYPHTKSTYRTYRSRLTSGGLIEVAGEDVSITAAGLALFGDAIPAAPPDHAAVMAMWRASLPAGSYAMLEAVVAAGPAGLTQDEMAQRSGYDRWSSTYRTYRSRLTSNGLVQIAGETVRATDTLYPEGGQLP